MNLFLIDQSFDLSGDKRKKLQDKATTLEKPTVTLTCHGKITPIQWNLSIKRSPMGRRSVAVIERWLL